MDAVFLLAKWAFLGGGVVLLVLFAVLVVGWVTESDARRDARRRNGRRNRAGDRWPS